MLCYLLTHLRHWPYCYIPGVRLILAVEKRPTDLITVTQFSRDQFYQFISSILRSRLIGRIEVSCTRRLLKNVLHELFMASRIETMHLLPSPPPAPSILVFHSPQHPHLILSLHFPMQPAQFPQHATRRLHVTGSANVSHRLVSNSSLRWRGRL